MRNWDSVSDGPVSVSPNTSTSIDKVVQSPLDVFHEADFSASESILQLGAQDHGFETLSKRLETAKRAVYRGRGIGVQVPWILGISKLILVVDLFSGFGGTALALFLLGAQFILCSADTDEDSSMCLCSNFPGAVHVGDVKKLKGHFFAQVLRKRQFSSIIVGGGSPCQGNSWLNPGRQGLKDPRSQLAFEICRIATEIKSLPEAQDTPVLEWLEMVESAPQHVVAEYSRAFRCEPLAVDAGVFGYVHRKRLFWARGPLGGILDIKNPDLPDGVKLVQGPRYMRVDYVGKHIPAKAVLRGGYSLAFDPADIVAAKGKGAIHVLTREFFHPGDRAQGCSNAAVQRFWEMGCRFPESAHEDSSVLWKGDQCRLPDSQERLSLHGCPAGAVDAIDTSLASWESAEARRNSLIGNGFHLPSIMIVFILLAQTMQAVSLSVPLLPKDESWLRGRVRGTVWQPGVVESWPTLFGPSEVVADMQQMFSGLDIPGSVWDHTTVALEKVDLAVLQTYFVDTQMRARDPLVQGPEWQQQCLRAMTSAALGEQRATSARRKGLDPLIILGLVKSVISCGLLH